MLALASPRDQYHERAVALTRAQPDLQWVSSVLVLDELYRHVLYQRGTAAGRSVVYALLHDPAFHWLDVTPSLVWDAVSAWIDRFPDQDFSLTDAVSFELMTRERVRRAFAFDRHFTVAGFERIG